jgi:AcrR family transcriptional regulator
MQSSPSPEPRPLDRRVQRSRTALMAAAVRLVSERSTTAIPVTDLAEAADVSRQLVYLQFGDRDALLVAAAADLAERELIPGAGGPVDDLHPRALALARHFAEHRAFYRAMLTGSCAFEMTRTLNRLFGPFSEKAARALFGELDPGTAHDLAAFVTGGTAAIVNDWLIESEGPLDPEELARRLLRLGTVFAGNRHTPQDGGLDQ